MLPSGRPIPVLGQGTWLMGENHRNRGIEIAALRLGLDLGMTLIDTAEMYGEGAAEELIGEAIRGLRAEVFLVSKVYPHNATRQGTIRACERSLRRLRTDYLDCYLLHWRGTVPLIETIEAFQTLRRAGKILDYGVSNFDVDDMEEAFALPGGGEIVTDQVLYNLEHRGIEWDLLPWCQQRGIPVMAYSPIGHSGTEKTELLGNRTVKLIAKRHGATPAQVALAWLLRRDVVAIPKASSPDHVRENRAALDLKLTKRDLMELDEAFPPPQEKIPLEMK
jgi:diketogulonate reductase-like aldo/keto reductase